MRNFSDEIVGQSRHQFIYGYDDTYQYIFSDKCEREGKMNSVEENMITDFVM